MAKASPLPHPVERALRQLGQRLSMARRRRHLSQQELATRIGASVNTIRRMEEGAPGIAIQHLARALQVFGELGQLERLLDTPQDSVGLALMDQQLPKRVRSLKADRDSGAF